VEGVVSAGLAVGGAAETVWTPAMCVEFSSRYRSALVAINLAIALPLCVVAINLATRAASTLARYVRGAPVPCGAALAALEGRGNRTLSLNAVTRQSPITDQVLLRSPNRHYAR